MTLRQRQHQELLDTVARMRDEGLSMEAISAAVGLRPSTIIEYEKRAQRGKDDPTVKRKAILEEMQQLLQSARVNNPEDLVPLDRMRYQNLELRAAAEGLRARTERLPKSLFTPEGRPTERALEGLRRGKARQLEAHRRMRDTIREMLPAWEARGQSRSALCRELHISRSTLYGHLRAIQAEQEAQP